MLFSSHILLFSTSYKIIEMSWNKLLPTVMMRKSLAKGSTKSRPYPTAPKTQVTSSDVWTYQRHIFRLPKEPIISKFKLSPKGLPIDFYKLQSYSLLQQKIPNSDALAFLPNVKQSLLPKTWRHPHKKPSNKSFTRKYWEVLAKPYGIAGGESDSTCEGEEDFAERTNEEGEGIDLTGTSLDASNDEYLAEGDDGYLYDDNEDNGFVVSDQDEENGDDDEDDKNDGDYDEAADMNEIMHTIPEGEEEW
ncbi:hypothetical protein VP01_2613g3 [Puccinia sorghi]|uniref:DNA-directed RNA polymerase III subunit n=1 Tax=Puccinia sorghi TaxID=27349 RepID=A0A0L6V4L1_9BASI|nr:hypothetical protein VP01_2613g3 [Puccinia sorghi]